MSVRWASSIAVVLMASIGCSSAIAQGVLVPGEKDTATVSSSSPSSTIAGQQPLAPMYGDPAPQPEKRRFPLQAFWDNGLFLESDDKQFHLHVGGVGQIDSVW